MRAERGEELGTWDIFVLDGIQTSPNQASLDGSESLRYLNLREGTRLTAPSLTATDIMPCASTAP